MTCSPIRAEGDFGHSDSNGEPLGNQWESRKFVEAPMSDHWLNQLLD